MSETLLARLGGTPTLEGAVHVFYDQVLTDPLVAPVFVGVDLALLRKHMTSYLVDALGESDEAAPRDLGAAHAHLRITDAMFDAVVVHLAAALEAAVDDADLVDAVVEQLASHRATIVTAGTGRPPPAEGDG